MLIVGTGRPAQNTQPKNPQKAQCPNKQCDSSRKNAPERSKGWCKALEHAMNADSHTTSARF